MSQDVSDINVDIGVDSPTANLEEIDTWNYTFMSISGEITVVYYVTFYTKSSRYLIDIYRTD